MPREPGSRKGVEMEAPPPKRREGSARAHGAEAVAHQRPGGDAFGDLAVDQEGRRALDVVLLGRGAGCVLQLLDRVDNGEARSEERRVGKGGVSTGRSRWGPGH